jgi:hypothetical protein
VLASIRLETLLIGDRRPYTRWRAFEGLSTPSCRKKHQ